MTLHRALRCSAAAALFVGLIGCDSMTPQPSVYPASKSATHMTNTQWKVSGEETPQAPMPAESAPAQQPAPTPEK